MRLVDGFLAAALALTVVGTAAAQSAPAQSTATPQATTVGYTASHWIATAFVGSGFGTSGDTVSDEVDAGGVAFGGQIGYLWRGIVGPEFIADFAPAFEVTRIDLNDNPRVNSYMVNAIAAIPLGADGRLQPYVSGGFGGIQMAGDVFTSADETTTTRQMQWGTNVGGGIMAFASDRIGLRGDVRRYHAMTNDTLTGSAADQVLDSLLSGLAFWRANAGLSFRW